MINPRTGRESKYLGTKVPDIGEAGLSSAKEVKGIALAIERDHKKGEIPYHTAISRLNQLDLIVERDRGISGPRGTTTRTEKAAKAAIARVRNRMMRNRGK